MQKRRGADAVVAALEGAGVEVVFTLSGNHIMVLYDALLGSKISLIHVRHEAAAVHMADAYARLTGRVGVALVTGGQGHTNAAAALPTACAGDAPVLLLSGHAPLKELGRGAFQEMEQAEFARTLTKSSWRCASSEALAPDILRAVSLAVSGRPGPVHVSLPTDLLEAPTSATAIDATLAERVRQPMQVSIETEIVHAMASAIRPIILAGPMMASSAARAALREFEDKTAVPAVVMESPRGLADPSLGAFAETLRAADLIVLLGKPHDFTIKFGQAPFIASDAQFIVVDPEPAMIERVRREQGERLVAAACADADVALQALTRSLAGQNHDRGWSSSVRQAVAFRPPSFATVTGGSARVHPLDICRAVQDVIDRHPDTIFVSDGGEIGQWAQTGIDAKRRIINGVAGSIGSAIPFALAARVVDKSAPVIAVLGDGTFGFHMAEIDTAVRNGLPVVLIVGNDARWNAEHQIQLRDYGDARAHACTLLPSRYDQVATALGGYGEVVTSADALPAAIERAIESRKPACLNVMIEGFAAPVIRRA